MSSTLQQRLQAVTGKAHLLASRYENLLRVKEEADKRIEELEAELDKERGRVARLKVEVEELRVVTTLTPRREDVEHAYTTLRAHQKTGTRG